MILGIISMSLLVRINLQKCQMVHCAVVGVPIIPRFPVLGLNEVDYSHYPERPFQLQWLRSYLEAYKEHKGQDGVVTDREVEILYVAQPNSFLFLTELLFMGLDCCSYETDCKLILQLLAGRLTSQARLGVSLQLAAKWASRLYLANCSVDLRHSGLDDG
ncbi:hypothetical protein XENOCAPTIV_003441 [Xenoophorus captivus]|uniref:Uncharacterized protein n=1 Tax=Xenoophorus captivus TaxID=1517983 RepID=A0ABV0QZE7_9TELE